jgi:hypothetical protein
MKAIGAVSVEETSDIKLVSIAKIESGDFFRVYQASVR